MLRGVRDMLAVKGSMGLSVAACRTCPAQKPHFLFFLYRCVQRGAAAGGAGVQCAGKRSGLGCWMISRRRGALCAEHCVPREL